MAKPRSAVIFFHGLLRRCLSDLRLPERGNRTSAEDSEPKVRAWISRHPFNGFPGLPLHPLPHSTGQEWLCLRTGAGRKKPVERCRDGQRRPADTRRPAGDEPRGRQGADHATQYFHRPRRAGHNRRASGEALAVILGAAGSGDLTFDLKTDQARINGAVATIDTVATSTTFGRRKLLDGHFAVRTGMGMGVVTLPAFVPTELGKGVEEKGQ